MPRPDAWTFALGEYEKAVNRRLADFTAADFTGRIRQGDHTLWSPEPLPELTDRLGWLDLPEAMPDTVEVLTGFASEVQAEGIEAVVLFGMGGSSLAPETFASVFGPAPGFPRLIVLDSTHPGAVRSVEEQIAPERTLFIVASKSGTTLETLSCFRYFHRLALETVPEPGTHFIAITDPGSPLEELAVEHGFRRVFGAPADVGGRFSALTWFGLVPAALLGLDVATLLARAREAAGLTRPDNGRIGGDALRLGAALGELALAGRDKVTFVTSPSLTACPAWIEQLLAESTGKDGRGIVPVADEPLAAAGSYGNDRSFVAIMLRDEIPGDTARLLGELTAAGHPVITVALRDREDLGGNMFDFEFATAAAGAVLGIHPFNQPDVQLAKDFARRAMAGELEDAEAVTETPVDDLAALDRTLTEWLALLQPGDYLSLQAYLAPGQALSARLSEICRIVRDGTGAACTRGYGPRFLHSTGQLHKGGPGSGLFLQLIDEPEGGLEVPGSGFDFAALIAAQAAGDYQALRQRGRRLARINLGRNAAAGLTTLQEALAGLL